MMKKILLSLVIMLGILSSGITQEIPTTINVKPVVAKSLGYSDWRVGLAFPVFHERRMGSTSIDLWTLTESDRFNRLYLGLGLDAPIWEHRNMRLGVTGGWSADFSQLAHIKNGHWSVGATLTIRF